MWSVWSVVGILFVIAKLAEIIDWSWWLVLAPFYVPAVFAIMFVIGLLAAVVWSEGK